MKILATTPIPTEELFKLRSECEALYNHIDNLLHLSYVETPAEETPKKEAFPDPKAEASAEPKKEASFEDGFLQGLGVKQHPTKPFEMVIE